MIKSYEGGKAKPDGLFLQRLSELTGLSEEKLMNKQLKEKDIPNLKVEKVEKGVDKKQEPKNHSESSNPQAQMLENLAESNRLMAEANKIQAEANRIQAESNRQLVESNRELTAMIKASITADAGPEIPVAVAAKFEDLLAVVAEVVGGKQHYKSPNEAFAEIHRLFYDPGTNVRDAGKRVGEGTKHIEK